ncbi:MAG: hypothetical protein JW818_14420, partial [Pirellulales bacterium]|nr:hypothetical protein [Pirellulales bacterium]
DGQTSTRPNPAHVYLHPGVYAVTLSTKHNGRTLSTTNRIEIDRPPRTWQSKEKPHTLDEYLPTLREYDPSKLDGVALRQLVLAYHWKVEQLLASEKRSPKTDRKAPSGKKAAKDDPEASDAETYLTRAVDAGQAPFVGSSNAEGDNELFALAKLIGPMARAELGDSKKALAVWTGAARRIGDAKLRAQCQIHAADVAVNDLLDAQRATTWLDAAAKVYGTSSNGEAPSRLARVRGDYHALRGEGPQARADYERAQQALGADRSTARRTALSGAHSRSTEEYLRAGQWARAMAELDAWQTDFPAESIDGYLTLLWARYWSGRQKHAQVVALSERLQAVNPTSPYADRLLLLSARAEASLGRRDRASATLHSLLKDYPGSPLVPEAKELLKEIEP